MALAGAIAVDEWIAAVGGGLNFKRKRFLLLSAIRHEKVQNQIKEDFPACREPKEILPCPS